MSQSTVQFPANNQGVNKQETAKPPQITLDEPITSLKSLQDDVGQISELSSEEKRVVDVFFESFLKLMQPLAKTLSVSPVVLPDDLGNVMQANVDPKGNLMLLFQDGQVEIMNLSEKNERDLTVCVMKDAMPKFKQLTSAHRKKIENRMKFLSSVTNEIQRYLTRSRQIPLIRQFVTCCFGCSITLLALERTYPVYVIDSRNR